jgi:uncharacterized protein YdhG (YjbR/CyaY superfamily)
MKKVSKAPDGKDVDKYLAKVPKDQRAALQKLRKLIKSLVPKATERISYQIPMFFYNGPLVSIAAFKNHCSFFVQSLSIMQKHKAVLKSYETTKSAIHFTPDKPLPVSLVKMFVNERLTENEARAFKRKKK